MCSSLRNEEWIKKEINNHQKSIDFKNENLQNYKDSILEYDQDNNLTQVAQKQIELLEIAFENGSSNRVVVYQKRVESIIQSLQNPDKQIKQFYQFNNQTKKYIKDYNLNLGRLNQFEGNFIEKNIHTEVVNAINDISNTMYAFDNKLNTDNIAQIIFESSDITLDLKDNKKYDKAYSLLDIMNGIFNIGKQSLFVAGEGILKGGNEFSSEIKNGIDFLVNASNEDLINGTLDIAKGLYYLIRTSPISLDHGLDNMHVSDHMDPLEKKEKFFPNYIDYCISKIHYGDQNKQFPSYQEWKPLAEKQFDIEKQFEDLEKERKVDWEKLKAEPRQFTVDTVSELTKLFLYCGLGEIATFKIGPLAKSLSNVMLDEAMLLAKKIDSLKAAANGIYDVTIEEIIQAPLINSIKIIEDAICKTVHGKPELITIGDLVALQVLPEHFKDVKKLTEVAEETSYKIKKFELGKKTGYKFKDSFDVDLRGTKKTYKDALKMAFDKTGAPKSDFEVTKWARDLNGKSHPVEWRSRGGAEVNIDTGHITKGPDFPHVGYQTPGKRGFGGAIRGHIIVDSVPIHR